MLVGTRKLDLIVIDKCESTSGKYNCFYGHHWTKTLAGVVLCYDVGCRNTITSEVIREHHPSGKAVALTRWDAFRELMIAKPLPEEKDEQERLVWLN